MGPFKDVFKTDMDYFDRKLWVCQFSQVLELLCFNLIGFRISGEIGEWQVNII